MRTHDESYRKLCPLTRFDGDLLWLHSADDYAWLHAVMLTRPTVSRPRPRPEVFKAKTKASHFKG